MIPLPPDTPTPCCVKVSTALAVSCSAEVRAQLGACASYRMSARMEMERAGAKARGEAPARSGMPIRWIRSTRMQYREVWP